MNKDKLQRISVLVVAMVCSTVAVRWVRSGYETRVTPLQWSLDDITVSSEGWTGEDVAITDDTIRILGADSNVNRLYRDPVGRMVAFHVAVWSDPEYGAGTPHHPEECYRSAGWEIMQRHNVTWDLEIGEVPVELISFQKGQKNLVTAHWYQMNNHRFTDSSGVYSQSFRLWGKAKWASTEKYLLHTEGRSLGEAEPVLRRLAVNLKWPAIDGETSSVKIQGKSR